MFIQVHSLTYVNNWYVFILDGILSSMPHIIIYMAFQDATKALQIVSLNTPVDLLPQ